ncbi:MAG: putative metal-binding motif-containing protein, partial [Deltaproteobacteria bacterium]|nr:putative metal-binding motif-containing protein [Deltaproteobacteria bacterium]
MSGVCGHQICEVGGPLAVDCDEATTPEHSTSPSGTDIVWYEEFADNSAGWTLGPEWQIGPAQSSTGHIYGGPDPVTDATTTSTNNGVAGVNIGGNAGLALHGFYYLTSPPIDTSTANDPVTLSYYRWLNSDYTPYMQNEVSVFNGSSWVPLWQTASSPGAQDSQWQLVVHDITAYKNSAFRVRFGFMVGSAGVFTVSSWNVDEVTIEEAHTSNPQPPETGGSCVTEVCAVQPSCCNTAWTQACVDMVDTVCGVVCLCDVNGLNVACYDDKYDHDADGFASQDGDCLDCDPNVNPGAFDVPGNGIDEDCSGTIDDEEETCDNNIPMTTMNPYNYAKAMDLCRQAPNAQPTPAMEWGVIKAELVQADQAQSPHSRSTAVKSTFGPNNVPFKGPSFAVFSSGTARAPGDAQYVNPNGQV